jgi:hypothetical protein
MHFDLELAITEVLSLLKDKGYPEFIKEFSREEGDKLHKKLQRGGIVGSEEFIKRVRKEAAGYQSKTTGRESAGKRREYKLFIVTGSFLLILIAGLGGIYFYFSAIKPGEMIDVQKVMSKAIIEAEDLQFTEWQIRLTPVSGGQEKVDTLSFVDGKFISGKLNTSGFTASNYSLTVEDTGRITWETMQTGPDGTASWRGEIEQGRMRGILSLRQEGKEPQDFSFISIGYKRRK